MADNTTSKLRVSRAEASEKICDRINIGKGLLERQPTTGQELTVLERETRKWTDYNRTLFDTLFDESPLSFTHGSIMIAVTGRSLIREITSHKDNISRWINDLESVYEQLEIYEELPSSTQQATSNDSVTNESKKIFIGHGRSHVWRELKDFIESILKHPTEEFNRISPAGHSTKERLEKMLEESCMAFLIMTGEDEQTDGSFSARDNVIHEVGLFQGKIGFEKAIILLEKGCEEFSNIEGLGQIRFSKGNIKETFGEVVEVLQRESII